VHVNRVARRPAAAPAKRRLAVLLGVRDPVVVILLLIAFFSAISGKPLDGLLIMLVAAALAWDSWARSRRAAAEPSEDEPAWPLTAHRHPQPAVQAPAVQAPAVQAPAGQAPGGSAARHNAAVLGGLAGVLGGILYAAVVGSFTRFSWPATIAVVGLGALVIFIGWQGPLRPRPVPGRLPLAGVAAWGALLFAGGLWELWQLLQQPSLTVTSYAHPTISALTDPVLSAQPGRALMLAGWLLIGWYLVRR